MATILFTILHFMGYTGWEYEWYMFCFLLAIDTVSLMLLLLNIQMWLKSRRESIKS